MIVAHNITALMEQQGLNPNSLAQKADLNRTGVYDIVKGKIRNPRLDTLEKISEALGVTVHELMTDMSDDDLRVRIAAKIDALPPEQRLQIDQMIDVMTGRSTTQKQS